MNAATHGTHVGFVLWSRYGWAALLALPLAGLGCGDRSLSSAQAASSPAPAVRPAAVPVAEPAAVTGARKAEATAAVAETSSAPQPLREITFDTVKFAHEKGTPFQRTILPASVEKLDGARIRVRGFILPSYQQSGITQFVLVRDNQQCCFGPQAALCDCMVVEMKPGQSTDFSVTPVAVEGTFTIHELKVQGNTMAVYHVAGESVR